MDEAERCHRVIYLSGGKIIVEGAPEQVVRDARLFAFEAFGADLGALVIRARATKDIANATIIGRNLRVVGTDRDSLAAAIKTLNDANVTWREVAPRLDDVFIHLLSDEG
jgi:ABC-2 type transport system ATP-binding protein